MSLSRTRPARRRRRRPLQVWFERTMVAIAAVNLGLVAFDLSYIPLRDRYLALAPGLTTWYGAVFKGIEPHRVTEAYLREVNTLKSTLELEGIESEAVAQQLANLRESSVSLVDENPFELAGKSGTLERIKQAVRDRTDIDSSSKEAFRTFWSQDYLETEGWSTELAFFDEDIRPRIETNYWRGIDFNGLPIDRFWVIDLGFIALFASEFLARTYLLSRRHDNTNWFDAMLWRLYDLPLFLPFWRWLRVIPVVLRANQAQLINLEPLRSRLNRVLISQFAIELTEVVILRMVDQVQNLVREGQVSRWLFDITSQSEYIDLNGVDEVQTIAERLTNIVVYQVLPEVKPDIDAVLSHSVNSAISQAPAYQGLQLLPGFSNISHQVTQQLSAQVSQNLYSTIKHVLNDEKGAALTTKLIDSFGKHLRHELRKDDTLQELQSLLTDLLEEVKVNYVERISEDDSEAREATTYRLYSTTQAAKPTPTKLVK